MADNYGDALAIQIAKRIKGAVANEAALSSVPDADKVDGALFLAKSEGSLWQYVLSSTSFSRIGAVPQVRQARGVVLSNVANLASFTVANNGVTHEAGDIVLLVNQTTGSQDGPYVVGTVAAGAAPLTRPSWWAAASVQPAGVVFEVQAGTFYALSTWKATVATAITVGTTAPAFYPKTYKQTVTLAAGTYTIGAGSTATPDEPLFLLSTASSMVNITRNTAAGTLTGTVMYVAPVADRVAGKAGTAAVVVRSAVEAGTIQNQDESTLDVLITNW